MRNKYLEFYNASFGSGEHCTKSWGLASFQAGAQSRQAEIDELQKRIDEAVEILEYNEYVDSPLQALNILKGETK